MKVILDTSTVLALEKASPLIGHLDSISKDSDPMILEAIENAIESLILYDEIFIDAPSFLLNYTEEKKILPDIPSICNYIHLSREKEENIILRIITKLNHEIHYNKSNLSNILENISFPLTDYSSLYHNSLLPFYSMFDEQPFANHYKDFYFNQYKEEFFNSEIRATRFNGQSFYHTIRYFYYLELQHVLFAELVLHPIRNKFAQAFSGSSTVSTNNIISQFEPIRKELYNQMTHIGIKDNSLLMPMVASYVLKRCKSPIDLMNIISDIRYSKEAISFREGFANLILAIKNSDYTTIKEVTSSLSNSTAEWNKSLKYNPRKKTKTINLSIPMIGGISTDINIPYSFEVNTSTKLLTFIHKMLTNK